MILRLVHPGRPLAGPLDDAARDYQQRLSRHVRVDELFIKPRKLGKAHDPAGVADALADEGRRLLEAVGPRDLLVALDREGATWSSEDAAARLDGWMSSGSRAICFALGSAWGLHDMVRQAAHQRWSFGALTLPHDLARVVLWEQLYRAQTIVRGEPYHK